MAILDRIAESVTCIKNKGIKEAGIGIVLGSGLGEMADVLTDTVKVPYKDIINFPISTVKGHAGNLISGKFDGISVLIMQGRFHFYEGYSMQKIAFPILVMGNMGVHSLILTNAAGAINPLFSPGDLMIIKDHINYMGANPLIGLNCDQIGPRFPDMSNVYDKEYRSLVQHVAASEQIALKEGIYIGFSGPSYETPAEIKMTRAMGADAVGMSTVPEAITARYSGQRVIGISCITNMAAGLQSSLNHDEVIQITQKANANFVRLLCSIIKSQKLKK